MSGARAVSVELPLPPKECHQNVEVMAFQCGICYDGGSEITYAPPVVRRTFGAMLDTLEVPSMSQHTTRRSWTVEELAFLTSWYHEHENKVLDLDTLVVRFQRSRQSICHKARNLGLTAQRRPHANRGDDGLTDGERARLPLFASAEERRIAMSALRKTMWDKRPHPRGALGMKHTDEAKARIGEKSRVWQAAVTPEQREAQRVKRNETNIERYGTAGPSMLLSNNPYSRANGGRREDLDNRYFRSRWEANYARYLRWLKEQGEIAEWEYEPQTFVFHGVTRGALTYTPDFRITENDGTKCWHEIKGWMDSVSKTKLKRFAKYYPNEKVIVIGEDEYKALGKWSSLIPGWEKGRRA